MAKVFEIRQDNRLIYVRALRSLSLVALLALLVLSIFTFRDELTLTSARNLLAKLKAAQESDVVLERYSIDEGLSLKYKPLGLGLAVVQSDFFYYIAGNDRTELQYQLKYRSPMLCASSDRVLIYDAEGTDYAIAAPYAVLYNGRADGTIVSASMNDEGDYALVTNPSGYRAAVTVYDRKNKEKCKWETSQEYVALSAVSRGATHFATVSFTKDGLSLKYFDAQKGEQLYSKAISESVYYLDFSKKDIVYISQSGIYKLDGEGNELQSARFESPAYINCSEGKYQVILKTGGDAYSVLVYNDRLEIERDSVYIGGIVSASFREGRGVILGDSSVTLITDEAEKTAQVSPAKDVLLSGDGAPLLVYNDRIEMVDLND